MSGLDYDGVTISLPFSDTITRQCVNITILQNGVVEPVETFSVNLVNFSPIVSLNVSTALVSITDSDSEFIAWSAVICFYMNLRHQGFVQNFLLMGGKI